LYDNSQATCVCLTGYYKKSPTECVLCPLGTIYQQGSCVICPVNSYLSGSNCVCYPGYISNSIGVCIRTSCEGSNSYININGICDKCKSPLVGNGKICQSCPSTST
jgi:hypothetical protein